ncbi:MAG: DUF4442 domain-containing protein [Flavisolibacter sp.]|jgi:hypothetical protein
MNTTSNAAKTTNAAFFSLVNHPLKFRLFLLQKLPAAYFAGLKVQQVNESSCSISVPYKWFTKNPFRSTYFACLSMAAEMSTGILATAHIYKRLPKMSMLVIAVEGKFYKKAIGTTTFTCQEGPSIRQAIEKAIALNEPQTIRALSSGYNDSKDLVAEFWITWSFKTKSKA